MKRIALVMGVLMARHHGPVPLQPTHAELGPRRKKAARRPPGRTAVHDGWTTI